MIGGKRRGSVVPPPPTSTANDGGGGGVAGGKCGEAESALPPLLEPPTEEVEKLQKTPSKAAANGDDAGEEENAEEEGEKENEDSDMEIKDGEVGDGEEETEEKTKLADGFYLIEAVRKKRIRKGLAEYFIKWRDWPESANTWEPLDNLRMSVPDVVDTFEASLQSRLRRKRKRRNSSSSLGQTRKKQQKRTSSNVSAEKLKIVEETLNPGVTNDTVITENDVDLVPSMIESNDDGIEASKNLVEHVEQNAELTGQNAVANGSDKTESADGFENARCTGARKRKSGHVRRFKSKSNSGGVDDLEKAASNSVRSENLELTSDDVGFKDKRDNARRNICTITEIIKPTNFTSYMTGKTANVCVTFLVKRSDGKEMTVDNKFLKSHFPELLLDFYEQRLWCKV